MRNVFLIYYVLIIYFIQSRYVLQIIKNSGHNGKEQENSKGKELDMHLQDLNGNYLVKSKSMYSHRALIFWTIVCSLSILKFHME